jgi:parvulin-like peptidyl-prolyl isomerase
LNHLLYVATLQHSHHGKAILQLRYSLGDTSEVFVKRRLAGAVLALVVAVVVGSVVGCGDELPNNAVAKVGEVYISNEEFTTQVEEFAAQYGATEEDSPEYYKEVKDYVLESMIQTQLALVEAQKLGLTVTDEEVQTAIDSIVAYYFAGDQAQFEEQLAASGMTLDEYKEVTREGQLVQKVYAEKTKDVTTVPEDEIAAYYEENKADFNNEASRVVRHILITPQAGDAAGASTTLSTIASGTTTSLSGTTTTTANAAPTTSITTGSTASAGGVTEADWAVALATAQQVRAKLVAGGDWTELAAEYSDDPSNKDSGGELGTVYEGETVEAFEEAAFSLELNEISEPVRTTYGYHIIQVTGITEGGQQTLEEVRDDIESTLLSDAKDEAWSKWVEEAKVEVGVIYRSDMRPTTTTTVPGETVTTVPVDSTTTTAPAESTTTTSAAESTTTAQP